MRDIEELKTYWQERHKNRVKALASWDLSVRPIYRAYMEKVELQLSDPVNPCPSCEVMKPSKEVFCSDCSEIFEEKAGRSLVKPLVVDYSEDY
jgi:hypothetical protein